MENKGISTVIGVILMLMITIALAGTAYLYISGTFTSRLATPFSVIGSTGSKVTIRNDGTSEITKITATLDGQSVNLKMQPIQPGQVAEIIPLIPSMLSVGTHTLRLCTSSMCSTAILTITGPGTGKSCLEILNNGGSVGDGVYTLKLDGVDVQVYCDMSTNDGGWTLAAVCKASEANNCWDVGAKGSVTNPNSPTSVKLSDSNIKTILNNGEKITRAYWRQQNRYDMNNPVTAVIFNKISNPNDWSSNGCGSEGKEFFQKRAFENNINADIKLLSDAAYTSSWGSPIYSQSTGCSCAVNGWSNGDRGDSCGFATWFASCESGPSMSHCCICAVERADLVVWIR
ncbi:MAG: fibrinogen-like YCDxxxxGGGW domain-containing protein [Candidatus Aenigmatarchaeota archaeon]|nr:hypothetical protein [Candidatus Aenigmarchaeota archaeon]